jgi:hypothetical protein
MSIYIYIGVLLTKIARHVSILTDKYFGLVSEVARWRVSSIDKVTCRNYKSITSLR